jgi:hypothetical protein
LLPMLCVGGCGASGNSSSSHLDSAGVVAGLIAAKVPIDGSQTYTAASDPNSLLGRPGQYVSKANFHDSRLDASTSWDVDGGGSIETFANKGDTSRRVKYVKAITGSSSLFAEYDYSIDTTLLRLSHLLTPDQAASYESALKQVLGGKITATQPTEAPTSTVATTTEVATTTQPPTTLPPTTSGPITQAEVNAVIAKSFNTNHAQIDSILRGDSLTEAVNDISYNQQTNVVNIDLASTYTGGASARTFYDDQAWQIGQGLSSWFWAPVVVKAIQGRGGNVAMLSTLAITLDGLRYVCPPTIENGVATKSVSMETWLATCRM